MSAKDKKKAKKAAKSGGAMDPPPVVEEAPPPPPDPPAQADPPADDFSWGMPTSKKVSAGSASTSNDGILTCIDRTRKRKRREHSTGVISTLSQLQRSQSPLQLLQLPRRMTSSAI